MTISDPIADFLTRIRNALKAKHRYVDIPFSKMKASIAEVLEKRGYVEKILLDAERRVIRVYLKYSKGTRASVIQGLKRVSKPGVRYYVGSSEIPRVLSGLGLAILTTPKGVVDGEEARRSKIGGEVLCYVW